MSSTTSTIQIVIDGVTDGLRGATVDAARQLGRLEKSSDDTDRSFRKLTISATKAFAGFGAVGNALPVIAGFATSVATASGALLVLPGAALGGVAAVQTLKLAFTGFGDAVTAADPAEFAEATKDMGKQAVNTAKAVRDLKPAFVDLRKEVQNQFFTGLAAEAKALGQTYLPLLRNQLPGIAAGFNGIAKESAKALLAPESVSAVNIILRQTKDVLGDLKPALGNIVSGILAVGGAGAREFGNFGLSVTAATERFKEFTQRLAESGRIGELIRNGREEFAKWGEVASNVGGIFSTIFKGISSDQGNFIDGMIQATAAVKSFLATTAGQTGLKALGEILTLTAGVTRDVFLTSLQAIVPVIAAAGPAIQELAQIIGSGLSAAVHLVAPVLEAFGSFLSENSGIVKFLTPLIIGLVVAFKGLSILSSLVLPLALTVLAMNAVGLASGRLTTALRILSFASGPIGILLAGVSVAVGIFAAANVDSGEAVKEHQQAIEGLKGTLDQYTGAVTNATRAQVAGEIASRTLADGATKLGDAVAAAGISTKDYTDAATGNDAALQKVNGQLLAQAKAAIASSDAYKLGSKGLTEHGISLDLVSAAALGNVQAEQQIADALLSTSKNATAAQIRAHDLVETYRETIGPLGEVGSALGAYNADLKEAAKQAQAAADANREFGTVLGLIKDGLAGLAGGGGALPAMVEQFTRLGVAANDSATQAGKSAEKFGGVEAGARKAAQSMQESRDSFIEAGKSAGLTAEQAGALADQIGLIPKAAETSFRTNATPVGAELLTLKERFDQVPDGKSILVNALTADAIAQLEALGFKVTQLPNGQFEVIPNTEKANKALDDLVAKALGTVGTISYDADASKADKVRTDTVKLADGSTGTLTYGANGEPAVVVINGVKYQADRTTGTLTLLGNPGPVENSRAGMKVAIDKTTGTITFLPNSSQVDNVITRLKQPTRSTHTIDVYTRDHTGGFVSNGAGGRLNAMGNLLLPMAAGGLLSGRVATVVSPNSWRIIGDNMTVPEAFIPLNGSTRSMTILEEAAARMGRQVVPLASGAVMSSSSSSWSGAPEIRVFIGSQELTDIVRTEIHTNERDVVRRARVGSGVTF